ncbi:hypothetical protein M422DRAFT_781261 [Sphaerobolus stellatus SS14]|uniref:Uncharacterized protein n=1 Tax=Sphaerobolus stellatus (strain SS14) TaxID=990650 RepID=A0A0C9VBP7_SPHS4|nr:hypothetical protein M422DRAFT_781261 [Sphaerobolus stellatus SS14]
MLVEWGEVSFEGWKDTVKIDIKHPVKVDDVPIPTSDQPCLLDERTRGVPWMKRGEELEKKLGELRKWELKERLSDAAREKQVWLLMEQVCLLEVRIQA